MGKTWRSSKANRFFDFIAPIYDKLFHPALSKFCRQGGFIKDGFILDIGGGTGRIAHNLQGSGQKILIVDLSFNMLLQAKQYPSVYSIMANGERLPLESDHIHAILIADAYHHFLNREQVLLEVKRMLEINGNLYIFEPNIRKIGVKIIALLEKLLGMRSKFFPIEMIERTVTNLGFKLLDKKEEGAAISLCFEKLE